MSYYGPLLYSESSTIYYRHTTLPMPYTESSTLSNRPSTPTDIYKLTYPRSAFY